MDCEELLAKNIVNYSLKVAKNDRVLITYQSTKAHKLIKFLIKYINKASGVCFINYEDIELGAYLKEGSTDDRINIIKKYKEFELNNFDVFINIKYNLNDYENKNIDPKITKKILEETYNTHNKVVNERKWLLLNYPSMIDAYKAKMRIDDFYKYSFDVMNINYEEMLNRIKPLKKLMEKTDKVRIVAKETDITFSIKNMKAIPCVGNYNLPDGEIYTAPVKDSVNGVITYNTPSTYRSEVFTKVKLKFKNGKIIDASCGTGNIEKLLEIFQTDEGARYIGEFSFGLNPKIMYPMGDILYDEKIIGSIHFTPGAAYKDCYNGNDSNVHWDLVLIQRKEFGGGEIYFDDKLIRKDGVFVLDELKPLNYDIEK